MTHTRPWLSVALAGFGTMAAFGRPAADSAGSPPTCAEVRQEERQAPKSFVTDVVEAARANTAYRRVIFTGAKSQLVLMSIPAGQDIGAEKHLHVEQLLVVVCGSGRVILDGVATDIGPGDAVVVTPGTEHNFINDGKVPLQLYTTYTPPNHIDGRVHQTKADAAKDAADEAFGRCVE